MNDWEWFFPSEGGRTDLLRSQVDELSASSGSPSARSARLSSGLTRLQGSLETRLDALAAAFDAYVELGDVREQLAAYGDTAAIRRDALAAVNALVRGRRAERVAPSEADDYWLPHAMNAVTALVAGGRDRASEGRARTLGPQADLFVVVLLGALGHGVLVADRVPDLLVAESTLTDAQVVLWRALLAGAYGGHDQADTVLDAVGARWRSALAGGDPAEWRSWVTECSGAGDAEAQLGWIRGLLDGQLLPPPVSPRAEARRLEMSSPRHPDPAEPPADEDPRAALRSVAGTLIAEGSEAERELLTRARLLRQRVQDPSGAGPAGPVEPAPTEIRALIRREFAATRDPELRARLLGWLRPGLRQAVEAAAAAPIPVVEPVVQPTPGGSLPVGPGGPDPDRLAQVRQEVSAGTTSGTLDPRGPAVAAGVLGLLALIGGLLGWPGMVLGLVAVAAVVLAVVAVLGRRRRRRAAEERAADLALVDQAVAEGRRRLAEAQAEQERRGEARRSLADRLRRDLARTS